MSVPSRRISFFEMTGRKSPAGVQKSSAAVPEYTLIDRSRGWMADSAWCRRPRAARPASCPACRRRRRRAGTAVARAHGDGDAGAERRPEPIDRDRPGRRSPVPADETRSRSGSSRSVVVIDGAVATHLVAQPPAWTRRVQKSSAVAGGVDGRAQPRWGRPVRRRSGPPASRDWSGGGWCAPVRSGVAGALGAEGVAGAVDRGRRGRHRSSLTLATGRALAGPSRSAVTVNV